MIATDETKCLSCRWQDREHVQCFDGHLQRRNLKSCEGYEFSEIPAQLAFERQEEHHDWKNRQTCNVGTACKQSLSHKRNRAGRRER